MRVTLNAEQSLFVIDVGHGYTCLGFSVCQNWTRDIARELGRRDLEPTAFGSLAAYAEYERAVEAARVLHARTGRRLRCQLTPQLTGLEHRRVEVIDCHGDRREFVVGRSTGFIPIHLELSSKRVRWGGAVTGAPFRSVRLIERCQGRRLGGTCRSVRMKANAADDPDLKSFLARCEGQIREQGFVTIFVGLEPSRGKPPYAYTVGLTDRYKRPELLVFGFAHDVALELLGSLVRRYVRSGFGVPLDQPIHRILECPVIVKPVTLEQARPYARFAISRCESLGLACVVNQVVVPDGRGVFPWESGYDKRYLRAQPKLFELQ